MAGSGAQAWGLWVLDPGPRGVRLKNCAVLIVIGVGVAD